jgi:predicted RNase H-like HicB family nuclease
MMGEGTNMRIDYTVHIWREGTQFVAHAMPFDVMSAGPTPDKSRAALDEAVALFLSTAREKGTLQDVLEECSYECRDGSWQAPEWIAVERHFTQLSA